MQRSTAILLVSLMGFALVGCNKTAEPEKLITINKKHELNNCIVEPFDQAVYSVDELKATIDSEIKNVNLQLGEGSVSLVEFLVENNIAKVEIDHNSAQAYETFNGVGAFIGTVKEAIDQGYLENSMVFVKVDSEESKETVQVSAMENLEERTIVIIEDSVNIKVYDDIVYYLDGMTFIGDKIAGSPNTMSQAMIIF